MLGIWPFSSGATCVCTTSTDESRQADMENVQLEHLNSNNTTAIAMTIVIMYKNMVSYFE